MPVCKHRLQIIQGKASGIVEGDMADLVKIVETGKAIGAPAMAAQYEKAKAEKARLDKKMENLLKGYIDARVRRLTGELKTDRNIDAARTDLERTIEEAVIAGAELSKALLALSKIFV
jgi:hypothetical protein